MIDSFIIQAVDILYNVIIDNKINISEMPAVQILALLLENVKVFKQFKT